MFRYALQNNVALCAAEQRCPMQRQSRGRESAVGWKTDARAPASRVTRRTAGRGGGELCSCFAPSTADFRPRLCCDRPTVIVDGNVLRCKVVECKIAERGCRRL